MSEGLLVEMRFRANPRLVSPMRRFIEESLEKFISDLGLVSRVATAAHELLENGSKYGHDGKAELDIELATDGAEPRLTLRLTNVAGPHHIDQLKELFTEMDAAPDPMIFWIARMRRNARMSVGSGLGLARIRGECEMDLALSIDGQTVKIAATVNFAAGALS